MKIWYLSKGKTIISWISIRVGWSLCLVWFSCWNTSWWIIIFALKWILISFFWLAKITGFSDLRRVIPIFPLKACFRVNAFYFFESAIKSQLFLIDFLVIFWLPCFVIGILWLFSSWISCFQCWIQMRKVFRAIFWGRRRFSILEIFSIFFLAHWRL